MSVTYLNNFYRMRDLMPTIRPSTMLGMVMILMETASMRLDVDASEHIHTITSCSHGRAPHEPTEALNLIYIDEAD